MPAAHKDRDGDKASIHSGSSSEDEEGVMMSDMFPEPPRPPTPPPTTSTYTFPPSSPYAHLPPLQLQLIGAHHSLWGHILFQSSIILSNYLLSTPAITRDLVQGRNVVEFGAGAGVPGLVCGKAGARRVVLTDYPSDDLLDNLRGNTERNGLDELGVRVEGFVWGRDVKGVVRHLEEEDEEVVRSSPSASTTTSATISPPPSTTPKPTSPPPIDPNKFQLLLLSDLIFNHTQHTPLLTSLEQLIDPLPSSHSKALVFHSHHLPQYRARDLKFFELAKKRGWTVEPVLEVKVGVQFEKDGGDVGLREKVWGWEMVWDGVVRELDSDDE